MADRKRVWWTVGSLTAAAATLATCVALQQRGNEQVDQNMVPTEDGTGDLPAYVFAPTDYWPNLNPNSDVAGARCAKIGRGVTSVEQGIVAAKQNEPVRENDRFMHVQRFPHPARALTTSSEEIFVEGVDGDMVCYYVPKSEVGASIEAVFGPVDRVYGLLYEAQD